MRNENEKWKGPFMISKFGGQQEELVNLQGRKMKNMVALENSKNFNEHNAHVRKEYKEEAKQVREEQKLQNVKDQEVLSPILVLV